MAQSHRVTNASELRAILDQYNGSVPKEINIEIALFQPMTDQSMLSASRNPSSNHKDTVMHGEEKGVWFREYLDLAALGKSWRQAWVDVLKALGSSTVTVTFDPTLPEFRDEDNKTEGIRWHVDSRERKFGTRTTELLVIDREFWCMMIVLATEGRMFSTGSVIFKLNEDPLYGWRPDSRKRMHKHLEALSK